MLPRRSRDRPFHFVPVRSGPFCLMVNKNINGNVHGNGRSWSRLKMAQNELERSETIGHGTDTVKSRFRLKKRKIYCKLAMKNNI